MWCWGEARGAWPVPPTDDEAGPPTALWFEGRILSDGDDGTGGGGICCDEVRRDAASECGDGGTELRSGMALAVASRLFGAPERFAGSIGRFGARSLFIAVEGYQGENELQERWQDEGDLERV